MIELKVLGVGDASVLDDVAEDVFDHALSRELVRGFLADPQHHIAVAIEEGRVIGFASAVTYVHPDKSAQFWINEVGVAPAFRRRGIGAAVMRRLLEHARAIGCREAWVATEAENAGARALYRSLDGKETEGVVMYTFCLGTA